MKNLKKTIFVSLLAGVLVFSFFLNIDIENDNENNNKTFYSNYSLNYIHASEGTVCHPGYEYWRFKWSCPDEWEHSLAGECCTNIEPAWNTICCMREKDNGRDPESEPEPSPEPEGEGDPESDPKPEEPESEDEKPECYTPWGRPVGSDSFEINKADGSRYYMLIGEKDACVSATADGKVAELGLVSDLYDEDEFMDPDFGTFYIIIDSFNGWSEYRGLDETEVNVGSEVKSGEKIGKTGDYFQYWVGIGGDGDWGDSADRQNGLLWGDQLEGCVDDDEVYPDMPDNCFEFKCLPWWDLFSDDSDEDILTSAQKELDEISKTLTSGNVKQEELRGISITIQEIFNQLQLL